jgi:hypothetical protein
MFPAKNSAKTFGGPINETKYEMNQEGKQERGLGIF